MRKCKLLLAIVAIFFAIFQPVQVRAENSADAKGFLEKFEELAGYRAGEISNPESFAEGIGIDALLSNVIASLSGSGSSVLSFFLLLLASALIMSLSESEAHFSSFSGDSLSAGVFAVFSAVIFSKIYPVIKSVSLVVQELSMFFSSLIPIFSGVLASSGNIKSAAAEVLNMNVALAYVNFFSSKFLLPVSFSLFFYCVDFGV